MGGGTGQTGEGLNGKDVELKKISRNWYDQSN